MQFYAGKGERTLALKQYQACCEVLRAELGVGPTAETERLLEEIRRPQPDFQDETIGPSPTAEPMVLPDEPSIAVLPFTNMSGDPQQEFFSDGIAEDIITALSKIPSLLVISCNSTFTYKGQAVDVKRVSHELGVRYVLEGSVRKVGNRVRVTTQLNDATTGHQLWA